jgi:hypothetical protein
MGDCTGNSEDIRHIVNVTILAKTPRFEHGLARHLASKWNFSTIYSDMGAVLEEHTIVSVILAVSELYQNPLCCDS